MNFACSKGVKTVKVRDTCGSIVAKASNERCNCLSRSSAIRRGMGTTGGKGGIIAAVSVALRDVIRGCVRRFGRRRTKRRKDKIANDGGATIVVVGPGAKRVLTRTSCPGFSLGGPESLSDVCSRRG